MLDTLDTRTELADNNSMAGAHPFVKVLPHLMDSSLYLFSLHCLYLNRT
jgi:hypothetical protein